MTVDIQYVCKLGTSKMLFLFAEGKRKKERREKERERIRKTIKTVNSWKGKKSFFFSSYLKMAHSIRYVQRFGEKLTCVCIYIHRWEYECLCVLSVVIWLIHMNPTCAVACIKKLVDHMMRNVFRGREKWVKLS